MTEKTTIATQSVERAHGSERRTTHPTYRFEHHDDGTKLHVELPGVPRENIELAIEGDLLRIEGRVRALETEGYRRVHSEFDADVDYVATFRIGDDVDTDAVVADYRDGVLGLVLPRKKPAKREITIREDA